MFFFCDKQRKRKLPEQIFFKLTRKQKKKGFQTDLTDKTNAFQRANQFKGIEFPYDHNVNKQTVQNIIQRPKLQFPRKLREKKRKNFLQIITENISSKS